MIRSAQLRGDGARRMAASRRRWRAAVLTPLAALGPLLLLLATCGPPGEVGVQLADLAPPSPSLASFGAPHFTEGDFVTADGARLPLRKWLPDGPARAVILALHGFNDYSKAFKDPATAWAKRGIATYAYDQRGFGGAPERGRWAGEGQLTVDAIVASRLLRRAYPDRPLYLLGESMGGGVALLAASGAMRGVIPGPEGMPRADVDGVILSAPAVWGRETMNFWLRLMLFAGVRLFPGKVLTGEGLHIMASDNLPMLRALGRDPMVIKGARIDTIYGLVELMDDALAAAPHLKLPTLLMYGAHDELVPRPAIADFVAHLPPAVGRRTLAYYPQGYHMLLRDLEGSLVAADVASWVLDPARPLPSHADAAAAARPWPPHSPAALAGAAMPLAQANARR